MKLLVYHLPLFSVVISANFTSSNVHLSTHVLFTREQIEKNLRGIFYNICAFSVLWCS